MKLAIVFALLVGLLTWVSVPGMSSSAGLSAGFEPTGLWLIGALTELSITEVIDLRVQMEFATPDIEGLMITSLAVLPHLSLPPIDLFVGVGVGVALTPPPYTNGLLVEGAAGVRLAPADAVSILLQVRLLLRWGGTTWDAGPVFEGGILINF